MRRFALLFGLFYLMIGMLGFIFHGAGLETSLLLGLFRINGVASFLHVVIGVLGVGVAFAGELSSRLFAWIGGLVLCVLGVVGLIVPHGFEIVPLGGLDVLLHFLTGALAIFAAFIEFD
jgi:hypothetical protein